MGPSALELAQRVIGSANRERPADSVLRGSLKTQRGLSRDEASEVSRAVFAYYRWRGWLDQLEPLACKLRKALDLAKTFAREPETFSDSDLVPRAVPAWSQQELEVTAAWARALQAEPDLWLRARPGQGNNLAKQLRNCWAFGVGSLSDALEYLGQEDLFRTAEFHQGKFEVQDLSSQAVGWICDPQPGETWWDACAGEGGKLLHLSDLMGNKGLIWASDRAAWRLQKLKRRAARARAFNYRLAVWDGGPRLPTKTKFDGVLVDAPCSAIGTWQRNPHARWTMTAEDVRDLGEVQKRLLAHAAAAVKPGGKLVYTVCTMTRSETEDVARSFEQQFPLFKRLSIPDPLKLGIPPASELFYWPQDHGGNGMFVAVWGLCVG